MTPAAAEESGMADAVEIILETVPEEFFDGVGMEVDVDETVVTGGVEVTVPSDVSDGVVLEASDGVSLTLGLPFADAAELVESDFGVVYDNGNNTATVPFVHEGGVVQVITTIDDETAPTDFAYDLDFGADGVLSIADDGGALVTTDEGIVIVTIDAPWAFDANGDPVATHYDVHGDTLVQVVQHGPSTAYPVIADPTISFGWAVYVRYSKSEVRFNTSGLGGAINDKAAFTLILCGKIPHWAAKAGCAAVGAKYFNSIYNTFKEAAARNQCVEVQLAHITYIPVVWKRYSC